MRDDFQFIACIPYPVTVPKSYVVASEIATMRFLRLSGLPIPNVYGYSPMPDNVTETKYNFMVFVNGAKLSDTEDVMYQLVQLEAKM